MVSTDSVSGQWRPRSACTYAQADQGLHCLQITYGPFSCVAHHHMLWVLIRSALNEHHTMYVFVEKNKKYPYFLTEKSIQTGTMLLILYSE